MDTLRTRSLLHQITLASRVSTRSTICRNRMFHPSKVNADLVAPPDPISNLRPILYENSSNTPIVPNVRHPYSLSEFTPAAVDADGDYELQFKLLRQQLDSFNQGFWTDSNTRFYAAKTAVLESLPSTITAREKEEALSTFYLQWLMQENERTMLYTNEWRRRNFQLISLSFKVYMQRWRNKISSQP
ncbi:hypothetical protein CVT24_010557 [Panaeolus cyanescens]|uniref:Uncharacterized protein n=1 Tax=Panaeolus cyanescens TaxID=181874 RepID=A0A409YYJ8_9AGAR|nr:hypothetical protein CVT24_010557 [Panaeolus cyanescens]